MDKDRGGMNMNEQALLAAIGAMMDEKLEASLEPIRQDIVGIKADIKEMKGEILTLKDRTTKLELTMEHQVDRAVGLVLDGHESLRQIIEGRLVTKDDHEQDQIRICALEGITKLHTAQIADLKKKTS
jgi:hypothetical protein